MKPTPRRPRRLRTGALVVVAAALLVLLAFTERDDGHRAEQPMTTTTITEAQPTIAAERTTTTGDGRAASGPLLPELTGTALVLATHLEIGIVDLDTGAVRSVTLPGHGRYEIVSATGSAAILRGPGGVFAVPVSPGEGPVLLADPRTGSWPVASDRPGHVWLVTHTPSTLEAHEVSVEGQATGRQFVRSGSFGDPLLVGVDGGLVIGALGALHYYDTVKARTTPIGHGRLLAGSGETIARASCEGLQCRLRLSDVRVGKDVEVQEPPETFVVPEGPSAFSPDGRWLAVDAHTPRGGAVALVNVADSRITGVHRSRIDSDSGSIFAFSPDSRWLFLLDPSGTVLAHRLGTNEPRVIEDLDLGRAVALTAVSAPAPLAPSVPSEVPGS
ncbi:MAG TPA: hypothetical protein VGR26_11785 [Acidimicrobiales bacterium]|nr:hypothetical protein [Acidimicrobiales bacterium]